MGWEPRLLKRSQRAPTVKRTCLPVREKELVLTIELCDTMAYAVVAASDFSEVWCWESLRRSSDVLPFSNCRISRASRHTIRQRHFVANHKIYFFRCQTPLTGLVTVQRKSRSKSSHSCDSEESFATSYGSTRRSRDDREVREEI